MKLSIVIPAYNEEKRIGRTLEDYGSYFKNLQKVLDFRIIVVINNTTDKTEKVVKAYKKKYKEISFLNFERRGKGFAIIEGFKEALKSGSEVIGFVDADESTSPQAFYELVKNLGNYDGIIASRYLKGSMVTPKQPIMRIFASRVFNMIVRILFMFPYQDTQCGAKLFKKQAIEKNIQKLGVTEWAFDVDLLYEMHKNGFRIKEYPTVWSDARGSKINLKKSSVQMFFAVTRLRLVNSIFALLAKPIKFLVKPLWRIVR